MKTVIVCLIGLALSGCATGGGFTPCYQLPAAAQQPGVNCIPNGGGGSSS